MEIIKQDDSKRIIVCTAYDPKDYTIGDTIRELAREGAVIITPTGDDDLSKSERMEAWRTRIGVATELYVMNTCGVLSSEAQYAITCAKERNIPITYLKDPILEKVTLCGSSRFKDIFHREFNRLTLEGYIVYTPAIFDIDHPELLNEYDLQTLDHIHRAKMKQSNYVFVINKDGYIGPDTEAEIAFCQKEKIPVKYLEDPAISRENPDGK